MSRHTAIIQRSPPFSGHSAVDAIEMLLALGNFELPAGIFFLDDGVYQLNSAIETGDTGLKSPLKMLGTLKFYDIEDIYVCKESLALRNIPVKSLPSYLKVIENNKIRDHLERYHQVIQF